MIKKNLGVSFRISLVLTLFSPFLGQLRFSDDTFTAMPIPFQLLRIFAFYFFVWLVCFTIFDYLKTLFLKLKKGVLKLKKWGK